MKFEKELIPAVLLRRYKRFLADVRLADGRELTVHTANTGRMLGCAEPGSRVWLSDSANPKRKYPHSWELVETSAATLVGINTARANGLVQEAIENGVIGELQGYARIRREVVYGRENSRIDLLLEGKGPACYVEVKNVTALAGTDTAIFPDAVSVRGSKHLRELTAMVADGYRAVMVYCVQRSDAVNFSTADAIDPAYGEALRAALAGGVEALAYRACVSPRELRLEVALPVYIK